MTRDRLDDAIDIVAARLTTVAHDEEFAQRITSRLPDRSGWSLRGLVLRGALGAIVLAFVLTGVRRTFDERSTDVRRPFDNRSTTVRQPFDDRSTIVQSNVRVNASSNDRVNASSNDRKNALSNDRENARSNDFERSLPALPAASALSLESLAPVSLTEDAPLTLVPLAIADLPLTAENYSQRAVEEQ